MRKNDESALLYRLYVNACVIQRLQHSKIKDNTFTCDYQNRVQTVLL